MFYVLYFNYCNPYHCGIDVPDILAAGLRITSRMFTQQELESVPPAIPIPDPYIHPIQMEQVNAEEPVNDVGIEYEVDEDSVCIIFNICYT